MISNEFMILWSKKILSLKTMFESIIKKIKKIKKNLNGGIQKLNTLLIIILID